MKIPLILIPCSAEKQPQGEANPGPILGGLDGHRQTLVEAIKNNPVLAGENANNGGILSTEARYTKAKDLYRGNLYNAARNILNQIPPDCPLKVLIVSGLYGIVQLHEGIRDYELNMDDPIEVGGEHTTPFEFWDNNELYKVVGDYIAANEIGNVWSLLPKTPPYHQLYDGHYRNQEVICRHVFARGMRNAAGSYRGKWLSYPLENENQWDLLVSDNPPPTQTIWFGDREVVFEYREC